jgi:hypothetical protein
MSCCDNLGGFPAGNPCGTPLPNTAACETLPSQIENFTTQFFGTVTKTEVDGVVSWVLPCSLDVGLPNNPRAVGEGLSCYFLRLFDEGILGLTGPAGAVGAAGTNGYNGFSITVGQFVPPAIGAAVSIPVAYNPTIVVGSIVFISSSGWYRVNVVDWTTGFINATLIETFVGATSPVIAGRTVQPTGPQGATGVAGADGAQGIAGPAGPAGSSPTSENDYVVGVDPDPTDFALSGSFQTIAFAGGGAVPAIVSLGSSSGLYLLTALVGIEMDSDAPAPWSAGPSPPAGANASITARLYNDTLGVAIGATAVITLGPDDRGQIRLEMLYQPPSNPTDIVIQAMCSSASISRVVAAQTQLIAIRIE